MTFLDLPNVASWQHIGARTGFEVAYFTADHGGQRVEGVTTATEDSRSWIVDYVIEVDRSWLTRSARIIGRSEDLTRTIVVEADGTGNWRIDGIPAPHLRGAVTGSNPPELVPRPVHVVGVPDLRRRTYHRPRSGAGMRLHGYFTTQFIATTQLQCVTTPKAAGVIPIRASLLR
ncbi:putative glycolipid-binding domain-containing protein [Nocardia anaemiae]|uniref:putative glycolipid-binding domain-containing protein n=1 Tax=Nocardia anaemiae TaxID=263910 RepID=UPI0012F4B4CA